MTKIAVVIGSTREGRVTDKLAKWVATEVSQQAEVETVDLRDYPMPFFDEAVSPRYNPERKPSPEVKKWLDKLAGFDAYVLVTPEYNRAIPGVLKNAIDVLDYQMDQKPVALVGHGSVGGAQAIATLRILMPGVGAVTIPHALFFTDRVGEAIDDSGMLSAELEAAPYGHKASLKTLTESLVWYADALKNARK
jgi:NAD(P)H-dependent FMN reductase